MTDNEVNATERALLIGQVQKNEALLRSIGVVTDEPEVSEGFDGGASGRESGPFPTDPEAEHAQTLMDMLAEARAARAQGLGAEWEAED